MPHPAPSCRAAGFEPRVAFGSDVSGLVARELEELVAQDARYEEARRRATEIMRQSAPRGGRTWRRDELHER